MTKPEPMSEEQIAKVCGVWDVRMMPAAYVAISRAIEAARDAAWQAHADALVAQAVAQEREACAKVCEDIADRYQRTEGMNYPELKSDAQTGASDCEYAIRARTQGGGNHG